MKRALALKSLQLQTILQDRGKLFVAEQNKIS